MGSLIPGNGDSTPPLRIALSFSLSSMSRGFLGLSYRLEPLFRARACDSFLVAPGDKSPSLYSSWAFCLLFCAAEGWHFECPSVSPDDVLSAFFPPYHISSVMAA